MVPAGFLAKGGVGGGCLQGLALPSEKLKSKKEVLLPSTVCWQVAGAALGEALLMTLTPMHSTTTMVQVKAMPEINTTVSFIVGRLGI